MESKKLYGPTENTLHWEIGKKDFGVEIWVVQVHLKVEGVW